MPAIQTLKTQKAATKDTKLTNGKTENRGARTFAPLLRRPPASIFARVLQESASVNLPRTWYTGALSCRTRAKMLQCEALRRSRGAKVRA